jgi:hypothetical protein
MNSIFTEADIIHTYSRAEAIHITANFPNEARLFKFPVAMTSSVWSVIDAGAKNPLAGNTYA